MGNVYKLDSNWLLPLQRSIAALAGVAGAGTFIAYSNDTTQLQFDAATSTGSLLALLDAETAHKFGIWASKYRLVPRDSRPDPASLATAVWGRQFVNPLGYTPKCIPRWLEMRLQAMACSFISNATF